MKIKTSSRTDGNVHHFSIDELTVSSGPCTSEHEAIAAVLEKLNAWISVHSAQMVDLHVPRPAKSFHVEWPVAQYTYTREVGSGLGSSVLQALIEKFGHLTNAGYCAAVGLVDDPACKSFGLSFSGNGLRRHRIAIAIALNQLPSVLWPGRSLCTMAGDDAAFVAPCVGGRKFPTDQSTHLSSI